jgi:hypothetical protein
MRVAGTIPIGVPINLVGRDGYPVRNDNLTNLAYVGSGDGSTPPEQYLAFRPQAPGNTAPVSLGETLILRNLQTGLLCRLVPVPAGYPLSVPLPGGRRSRALGLLAAGADIGLMAVPASCATYGVIADQLTEATATVLTYTGWGMSYQGVPLVQSPGTRTLILSSRAECSVAGGQKLGFPLAPPLLPPPPALGGTGEHGRSWLAGAGLLVLLALAVKCYSRAAAHGCCCGCSSGLWQKCRSDVMMHWQAWGQCALLPMTCTWPAHGLHMAYTWPTHGRAPCLPASGYNSSN